MVPRVYIAAPFPMMAEALQLRALLHKNGIDCTSRWLIEETTICAEWANRDLEDVMQAHAVVAINTEAYYNVGTGGRHVEVGYALANAIPIFVLGGKSNIFHELCMHIADEETLIAALRATLATFSYHHHLLAMRALFARVHRANRRWWIDLETGQPKERNFGELLMLVTSELAEAMEGDRKSLSDDKLPQYEMRTVELADALIRLFDMAGSGRYGDVASALEDKMTFNACRLDHTDEHRKSQHGKKY